jgi:octaprenyl-diphosphate synthase
MFVFFSADLCGEINESTYTAASLIELLHTATLVHDDVVDNSNLRRGIFSINALWKNKIAVLVGDYLLSKGLIISLEKDAFNLLQIVSNSVKEMSEGELLQIEKARKLDVDEEVYFEIIRKKTASLIASCCACGAESAGASKEITQKMWLFGEYVGTAFQIKDDLFDFEKHNNTGKPSGIDIKDQKMTLPLIHLLNHSSYLQKKKLILQIKSQNKNPKVIRHILDQVKESGGIDYAREKMYDYKQKALKVLGEMPDKQAKESLKALVNFTIERQK